MILSKVSSLSQTLRRLRRVRRDNLSSNSDSEATWTVADDLFGTEVKQHHHNHNPVMGVEWRYHEKTWRGHNQMKQFNFNSSSTPTSDLLIYYQEYDIVK